MHVKRAMCRYQIASTNLSAGNVRSDAVATGYWRVRDMPTTFTQLLLQHCVAVVRVRVMYSGGEKQR